MTGPDRFARRWMRRVADTSYVSMSPAEVEELLRTLSRRLAAALGSEPFDPAPAAEVGEQLVAAHFTDAESLGLTIDLFGTHLGADLGPEGLSDARLAARVAAVAGELATGYAGALWLRSLDEQEHIGKAVMIARARAEEALRVSESRFRAVFAGAGIGIGIADVDGNVIEVNQMMADMMGMPVAAALSSNLMSTMDNEDQQTWSMLARGERDHVRFEKRYCRPDGAALWLDLTVSLIRDENRKPRYTVTMARDITQRHLLQDRLRHEATHDPLTQLPNRTLFFDRLTALFASAGPTTRLGLCYLGLDGFKVVNDTLGHDAGDELLVAVARRLEQCVSARGYLAVRMGGDEFVLLVEDSAGVAEVTALADTVLAALEPPIHVCGHRLVAQASVGIVECPVRETSLAELMKAADITLYWAKSDGRGRWTLFDEKRNARQVARYALSSALPAALEAEQFVMDYQPLVRLCDGAFVGVEALVRWRHPQLGRLAPDDFIGLAEETGLIVPLGRWVLTEACRQVTQWSTRPGQPELFISVNLSPRQVRDAGIVYDVARILDQAGLEPGRLQLELTEGAVMGTADGPLAALRRLAEMGVRIAIDDFGTGYSNLAYLRQLPVHALKLAGSFVASLRGHGSDPVGERIVEMLVGLAHTLGLSVTAEGVEAKVQAERLLALGCDLAQGWYFSRPVSPSRIARLVGGGKMES